MKLKILLIIFLLAATGAIQAFTLQHPCLLHTEADFDYVKDHITEEPYATALKKLKNSQYCKTSYKPSPVEYLARLDANNWKDLNSRWENAGIAHLWYEGIHTNYTQFMRDAAAAYQLALLYKLENNTAAANAAKNIITQWTAVNKGLLRNKEGDLIDPNERLIMFQPYQMAVAAEMLRDYNGWGNTEEFRKACSWMDEAFYPVAHEQIELQNSTGGGHYWLNWDLASMTTVLALGILRDNQQYIDEALNYYKGKGGGPGNILKGVPYLHQDPDSDEILGQGNELGRDQGHNTLCAAVMGTFCQMALAIGEDLFAYDDYRALKFAEYVAKYNLAKQSFYPDPMQNFTSMKAGENDADFEYPHSSFPFTTYTYGDGGRMIEPSQASRGSVRPGWDYWVGYANANGLSAIYSGLMAERIRPDGGGGQYSGNSGGFDQIGFSTLMGYRPFQAHEIGDEINFECIADTWIRQDSPTVVNGTGPKIELRMIEVKNDDGEIVGANYHAGLISFRYDLPEEKEVEQALLHLVSERVKGGDVRLYSYSNNFDEAKACWNTESKYAENFGEPITTFTAAGQKNKAIYDGGITSDNCNLDAWTNNIDITEYVKSLPEGTRRVNLMMKEDGDQVCFFSKDNQGQEKAFKDTEGMTDLLSSQLKPYLKVIFSKDFTDSDEDGTLGIAPIAAYEGKMEYFNIQGMRISTPRKGEICIVKKGNTVRKTIYR